MVSVCLKRHECPVSPGSLHLHCTCVVVILYFILLVASTCGAQDQSPQEVEIIKQINRVNEDGSYTYGYEAADGSFKIETRDVTGTIKGMFGFIDENGELKRVSYTANNGTGFKTTSPTIVGVPTGYTTTASTEDGSRRPVIQHIPRRQVSTTTPSYGEYIKGRRTSATSTPQVTEEPGVDEPTQIPLRKLLVTKRPVGKGGNSLRRQLGAEPDAPSSDAADVYSGGGASPRFVPVQSVRSPQSSLLANLPPHVAGAIRQQQLARAAASIRGPPRPVDEQQYPPPRGSRSDLLPSRIPVDDGPIQIPFPMASLRSLRDELMEYILQYLQYRLGGGNPYINSPYSPPFQNPMINPNVGYQTPLNYQIFNPNPYNLYGFPYGYNRGPFQPPVNPIGYPPLGYPGQTFPQPLPFSSPNKQQAGSPSQRSAPASTFERQETRGSSDDTTYTLPPADVLRLMLTRGLQSSTTSAPVRNVQILGAASSVSSTTVRPPAPVDEMDMEA